MLEGVCESSKLHVEYSELMVKIFSFPKFKYKTKILILRGIFIGLCFGILFIAVYIKKRGDEEKGWGNENCGKRYFENDKIRYRE